MTASSKTLALGVYPDVSLAKARQRREKAREQLADGIDPGVAKREEKQAKADAAANTFETVSRDWLAKTANKRAAVTQAKVTSWLEKDVFPFIGKLPISTIRAKDVLDKVARRMEARGIHESAHRIVQICSQVFRYAVAIGLVERDVTVDLRGALVSVDKTNYAAITEPKQVGQLMRSIHAYEGHPTARGGTEAVAAGVRAPRRTAGRRVERNGPGRGANGASPARKMKMKVEHLVPLSRQAVEILRDLQPFSGHGRYVFPSIRTGERCMSENTVNAALRGMGYAKEVMTAHGFRAMARTIMDEVLGERA